LGTIHAFTKEINRIRFHVIVLSPLQHLENLDYNEAKVRLNSEILSMRCKLGRELEKKTCDNLTQTKLMVSTLFKLTYLFS